MRAPLRSLAIAWLLAHSVPALGSDALSALRDQEVLTIEETRIEAFDDVFGGVREIHEAIEAARQRLIDAEDRISAALDLDAGTPLRVSMWEIRQRAGGPVEVTLEGSRPILTVGGNGDDEVEAILDAVNQATEDIVEIPGDVADIPPRLQEILDACQAFPGQLTPTLLGDEGIRVGELPKVSNVVSSNVKAVAATPGRLDLLLAASEAFLTGIPEGLLATDNPVVDATDIDAGKRNRKARASAPAPEPALPASPVASLVTEATRAFADAEVADALQLLARADAALDTLDQPVPPSELQALYQTAAVVHLVGGNAVAATASVVQALTADREADPLPNLGPDYAKLRKHILKSGVLHDVRVTVHGDGHGFLSGQPLSGDSTVEVVGGKHVLQIQQDGRWNSQIVFVTDGFVVDL